MWTGMSRVYQAGWKGPSGPVQLERGPNTASVVQTRPKGYDPEELPEFSKLTDQGTH